MRVGLRTIGLVAGAAAMLLGAAGQASADPSFAPVKKDIVGVGSDTTQDVLNAYATAYDSTSRPNRLVSYNATGSATIDPDGAGSCPSITRPNGSTAGKTALANDTSTPSPGSTTDNPCLDFARSSSGPVTTPGSFLYVAFGRDGVTWSSFGSSPSNVPTSLTPAQLKTIYNCTVRNWNQVGATSSGTILPYLPQAGSGTRAFFLKAIGLTDSTVGSCVNQSLEENNGSLIAASAGVNKVRAIAPYSIAKWVAQSKGFSTDNRAGIVLKQINGKAPLTSTGTLNTAFDPAFLRLVYNVTRKSSPTSNTLPSYLVPVFGTSAQGGYICSNQTTLTNFGFASLGAGCGVITTGSAP